MSIKTPSSTIIMPVDPAIYRVLVNSYPFNRQAVSNQAASAVSDPKINNNLPTESITTTALNTSLLADKVSSPTQVTAAFGTVTTNSQANNTVASASTQQKKTKTSAPNMAPTLAKKVIVPKKKGSIYPTAATNRATVKPFTSNLNQTSFGTNSLVPSVQQSSSMSFPTEPVTNSFGSVLPDQVSIVGNVYTGPAGETIVNVNGGGDSTNYNNFTVTTATDNSVVIAGLTNSGTSLVAADQVSIYNTTDAIYVTGIDQGTTQQYINVNSPGGVTGQIQINQNGKFGAATGLNYISGTQTLIAQNLGVTGQTALGPVENVSIAGGSTGQVLTTDGSGNLYWTSYAAKINAYSVAFADADGNVVGSPHFEYKANTGFFILNSGLLSDNPENVVITAAGANTSTVSGGSTYVSAGGALTGDGASAGETVLVAGAVHDGVSELAPAAKITLSGSTDVPSSTPLGGNITLSAGYQSGNINFITGGGSNSIFTTTFTGLGEWLLHTPNPSPLPDQPYSAQTPGANGQVIVSQGPNLPPIWANLPAEYVLPVATANTLGGVKIGENVSVTLDGVISVPDIPRTIPELHDVDASAPVANGSILIWDTTVSKWVASTLLDRQTIEGGEYGP